MSNITMPFPFTPESGRNMTTDTGIVFYDVDMGTLKSGDSAETFFALLGQWINDENSIGATTADPVINIPFSQTRITTNGLHADVVGMTDNRPGGDDGCTLAVTMQELTEVNWMRIFPSAFRDPETNALRVGRHVPASAYKNMAHVTMNNRGDFTVHVLRSCIQSNNVAATYSNTVGTPANVPVVFRAALASIEELAAGVQPYDLYTFPADPATGVQGASFTMLNGMELKTLGEGS